MPQGNCGTGSGSQGRDDPRARAAFRRTDKRQPAVRPRAHRGKGGEECGGKGDANSGGGYQQV